MSAHASKAPAIALFLPNLEGGGAEGAYTELANLFAERGHRVDFVLAEAIGPNLERLSEGVRVVELGRRWLALPFRLSRYLRAERPAILFSGLDLTNMVAVLAAALAGVPERVVLGQRAAIVDVWRFERPRTWPLWLKLMRMTYVRARAVVCNSQWAADEVIAELRVPMERVEVVYNPVDVDGIEAAASEALTDPWALPGAPPLVVSVGSLTPRKDVPTLLRAFAKVRAEREVNLLILGEGGERAVLERQIHELGLADSVRMPGYLGNPFPWIRHAEVLVSASRAEGCPNVIQQALATGTSIVATDCPGGTSELLERGVWGRLVPVGDPDRMADAILETLGQTERPDGRVRAAEFDRSRIVDQYLTLLLASGHMEVKEVKR